VPRQVVQVKHLRGTGRCSAAAALEIL
jgi:hypothetical protein